MDDDLQAWHDRWFERSYEGGLMRREATISDSEDGATEICLRSRYDGGPMVTTVVVLALLPAMLAIGPPLTALLGYFGTFLALACSLLFAAAIMRVLRRGTQQFIVVSTHEIRLIDGVQVVQIPVQAVKAVNVQAFSSASWDPFIALETELGTLRVGWGLPEEAAHDVANVIRRVLPTAA